MDRVRLGRTGLTVSVAGLGAGGHSRLGLGQGKSIDNAVAIVRRALDLGVDFIDTAAIYGTEAVVGAAIKGRRDQVVISTKNLLFRPGTAPTGTDYLTPAEYKAAVEGNLQRLGTDYLDILHVHGVCDHQYPYCREALVPVLHALRDEGKVRFLAISERFIEDPRHAMLELALADDVWDVVMIGLNLVNQGATRSVLPKCIAQDVGTLIMFAVRSHLSNRERARTLVDAAIAAGEVDPADVDPDDPLGFLLTEGGASSLTNACYRFARYTPGANVILTGTGDVAHLEENIGALSEPPLPAPVVERLQRIFGNVTSVSGE